MVDVEAKIRQIIRARIHHRKKTPEEIEEFKRIHGNAGPKESYDGFDMSGYNDAHYRNMELLSRFRDLMHPHNTDWRKNSFVYPSFWKGGCTLLRISVDGSSEEIKELSGNSTEDILLETILCQNPDVEKIL